MLFIVDGGGFPVFDIIRHRAPALLQNYKCGIVTNRPTEPNNVRGFGRVTDSAAGATALATGVKVRRGTISVDRKGNALRTCMDVAKDKGYTTGFVVTSKVSDATPAAFVAHARSRNSTLKILDQMLAQPLDIMLGSTSMKDWASATKNFQRNVQAALDMCKKNRKKNYCLMIESSNVDKACHRLDKRMLTNEIDATINALRLVNESVDLSTTTVIVTADHATSDLCLKNNGTIHMTLGEHVNHSVPFFICGLYSSTLAGQTVTQEGLGQFIQSII